jgi:hypothetical protein
MVRADELYWEDGGMSIEQTSRLRAHAVRPYKLAKD